MDACIYNYLCRQGRAAVRREMARRGKRTPGRIVPHGRRLRHRWQRHRWHRRRSFVRRGRRTCQWYVPPPMSRCTICNSDDDSNNHKNYLWRRPRKQQQSPLPRHPSMTEPSAPRTSYLCRLRQSDHRRATFRPTRRLYRSRRWRVSRDLNSNSILLQIWFILYDIIFFA